ncbi:hypothetical protein B0H13DRAFT_2330584 [Mycena leptocephala]|nr:hypothetical protein B0H13DRAFT_2330584 [Mycena leptocephala]
MSGIEPDPKFDVPSTAVAVNLNNQHDHHQTTTVTVSHAKIVAHPSFYILVPILFGLVYSAYSAYRTILSHQIAEYAVAFFDYSQTLSAEYRLDHHREGFFYDGFSAEKRHRFYWLAPIFKLVLYTISQAILAIRTYAVSCKSPLALRLLILLSVLTVVSSCTSGNLPGVKVASLFDVGVLVFDVVTMFITASYLWKFSSSSRTSIMTTIRASHAHLRLEAGTYMGFNRTTLGYAATMIFSGHFILNLSEHVRDGVSGDNSSIFITYSAIQSYQRLPGTELYGTGVGGHGDEKCDYDVRYGAGRLGVAVAEEAVAR